MRWTQKRRRATVSQGEFLVSDTCAQDDPTGSKSHQAGSDGDKTNSSPGRARHKP
jgi:hypothetical protein